MYKTLALFALAGLAACQQQAPATQAVASPPAAAATQLPPASLPPAGQPLPILFTAADTLTRPMRTLLQGQDLAPLLQSLNNYRDGLNSLEGFLGPEHYHFALVLSRVARDAADPAVYHVAGKSRYYPSRTVRPFTGTLTVRQVADLSYPGFLAAMAQREENAADSLTGRTYTAHIRLRLQEEAAANSGLFEGEELLDFYVVPGQPPGFVHVFDREGNDRRLPTRGDGLLLRGNRRNVTTGQVKSFIVSPDVSAIAPDLFKDFMLDERMGQINPKYARLGWRDYWQNEEWWADSPKPTLL